MRRVDPNEELLAAITEALSALSCDELNAAAQEAAAFFGTKPPEPLTPDEAEEMHRALEWITKKLNA